MNNLIQITTSEDFMPASISTKSQTVANLVALIPISPTYYLHSVGFLTNTNIKYQDTNQEEKY